MAFVGSANRETAESVRAEPAAQKHPAEAGVLMILGQHPSRILSWAAIREKRKKRKKGFSAPLALVSFVQNVSHWFCEKLLVPSGFVVF